MFIISIVGIKTQIPIRYKIVFIAIRKLKVKDLYPLQCL